MSRRRPYRPVVLIVRDGWGENPHPEHDAFNAVRLARTPVDDRLRATRPRTLIKTSGEDVGLPAGTMGNSEVGHQNLGAGRVVDQEIMRITRAIREGRFFENEAFRKAFAHAAKSGRKVHLLGLVSDGLVHSDVEHLFALIDLAKRLEFPPEKLFVHVITDGRDTGPTTGLGFVSRLEGKLREAGTGRIASVIGRYWAMDRDHRWERIAGAYRAMTGRGEGRTAELPGPDVRDGRDAASVVRDYYQHPLDPGRKGDEFIPPTRITDERGRPIGLVEPGDSIVFFNFRGDRPRQITKAFVLPDEAWAAVERGGFQRGERPSNVFFCTMTGYEKGLPVDAVAFEKPPSMKGILGEVVARAGGRQFRAAETEKFAHVTFFFNDYREEPFEGEMRLLVPSPKDVATYDLKPEMSAPELAAGVVERLRAAEVDDLVVVNFANGDMVGHTGNLDATVKAIEAVDAGVGVIVEETVKRGGALIVTADHGNAEQMWDPQHDAPHTAHTTYDVPLYLVAEGMEDRTLREGGRLADVAPTILDLMGLATPAEMTGRSLLETANKPAGAARR